jgi:hypothetical protein
VTEYVFHPITGRTREGNTFKHIPRIRSLLPIQRFAESTSTLPFFYLTLVYDGKIVLGVFPSYFAVVVGTPYFSTHADVLDGDFRSLGSVGRVVVDMETGIECKTSWSNRTRTDDVLGRG